MARYKSAVEESDTILRESCGSLLMALALAKLASVVHDGP